MILSFAWTAEAFISGRKKRTRRDWDETYAAFFKPGIVHRGYNRSPRVGGHSIGNFTVPHYPRKGNTADMTEEDYELEGFAYMEEHGLMIPARRVNQISLPAVSPREFFENWKRSAIDLFVVDFNKIEEMI